jgi:hypothetical protein
LLILRGGVSGRVGRGVVGGIAEAEIVVGISIKGIGIARESEEEAIGMDMMAREERMMSDEAVIDKAASNESATGEATRRNTNAPTKSDMAAAERYGPTHPNMTTTAAVPLGGKGCSEREEQYESKHSRHTNSLLRFRVVDGGG